MTMRTFFAAILLLALAGCGGDSESSKRSLIGTGNKYFEGGKYKEASLIYQKVIAKDALYGEAYYRLGLSELAAGRPAQALRALRRASELQPNNNDAHSKLADMYMAIYLSDRKKHQQFLSDLRDMKDRLLKLNPKSFEGLRIEGYLALSDGNQKLAIEKFEAADQVNPSHPNLSLILGEALHAEKRTDEAVKRLKAAIEKNKNFFPLYDALYVITATGGNEAGAEQILRDKIANNPAQAIPIMELAGHFLRLKRPDEVAKTLETLKKDLKQFPQGYQQVGDFYFRMGNLDQAQKEYEAGVTATPDQSATLRKKMVELFAVQGKTAEAIDIATKLVQENAKDPEARALRAALRLRSGKKEELEEAVKEFNAVLPEMPNNPVLRYNLGEAYLSLGDADKAVAQLTESIKNRPAYVPPKLTLGRIYLIKGEFAKAQQIADEVLKSNSNLVMAHILKAASLMGVNDFKAARTELTDLLKVKSDLKDAQYMLSQVNMLDRKLDAAEDGFRSLVKSGDMRGVFGLVDVMLVTKRHDQAAQMLKKEIDRPESAKNAVYLRALRTASAMVAVASGKFEEAVPLYETLVAESPAASDLLMRLGDVYLRANKPDLAYQTFEKAKHALPTDPSPILYMAMSLEQQGKRSATKPLYEQILKMSPDNAIALNNYAYYLMENSGDLDQALTYAQRAKQRMPNNPDVADTLGLVYIKKNLSDDAIKIFQGLVNQRPGHVTWRYHLALAFEKKGDKLQARKECETALKNKPNQDEERKIRDLMGKLG